MIELLVMRHGQSQADLEDRHEARADFPLTDLGREQARLAAAWLAARDKVDRILTSTLVRAAETARIVSEALDVPAEPDERLMEMNNGELAGMLRSEARVRFAGMFASRRELAPFQRFPGGETPVEFRARIEQFLSELLDTTPDGHRVLLVSHGGAIAMLFRAFLRLPVNTNTVLTTGDTGVHCWQLDGDRRLIRFANALSHLEGLPAG